MKKIWILTDDRAGNNTQVVGIAEALSLPYEEKKLAYNSLVKLPNFIRGASLIGVKKMSDVRCQRSEVREQKVKI